MITAVTNFGRSWASRFLEVQGVDRAMAIAAQGFSALIPLLIVYTAVVSRADGRDFASTLIERFDLRGSTAQSVREAFAPAQTVEDSVSLLGVLLLLVAALSFARAMQRLYEGSYGLPTLGMRNSRRALGWLALVVLYSTVRPLVAGVSDRPGFDLAVALGLGALVWTATPSLLLGRRVPWRTLLPGAILSAVGMTGLAATSALWFPRALTSSAEQFGVMGVAFALLSWCVAAAFVLVIAATGGAVLSERMTERWGLTPARSGVAPHPRG